MIPFSGEDGQGNTNDDMKKRITKGRKAIGIADTLFWRKKSEGKSKEDYTNDDLVDRSVEGEQKE